MTMKLAPSQILLALLATCCVLPFAIAQDNECIVTIGNGEIIGSTAETANPLKKVCAYKSIPYASPPIGFLRFKPPVPAAPWGSMDGTKNPNWCPQYAVVPPGTLMAEDCLYLNVYQPQTPSNESLPVMIFFHGGSFTSGSSVEYTPTKLLAREDVILVVVHYRLGLLGFLSSGDAVAPGNYGLKDQAFSIRWVHENIRAFKGDPGKVTIFGESAGAAAAMLQMLSPLNKGLIHGVIAQSGTPLNSWVMHPGSPESAAESAKVMARRLNCPQSPSWLMVDCFSKLPWLTIVLAQSAYTAEYFQMFTYPYSTITPVVEPNLPGAFITQHPLEIMKSGEIDNIPVILGANKHDGSFVLGSVWSWAINPKRLDQDPEYMRDEFVPQLLKFYGVYGDDANRAAASTVEMHFLSGVNRSSWNESMTGLVDASTVLSYKSAAQATAELLSKRGMDVYLYSMEHHSQNSLWTMFFGAVNIPVEHMGLRMGMVTNDLIINGISKKNLNSFPDMIYMFDFPGTQFSEQDAIFSEKLCELWTNFASSGNPTPSPSDRYDQWPVYNVEDESYMKLNVTPTAMPAYRSSWMPNGFEWN